MAKSTTKIKAKSKPAMVRRTFMFDQDTDTDVTFIRGEIRATSDSEAVRRAVRKMAELLRQSKDGGQIIIQRPNADANRYELI